jgi:hypothetical protein
MTVKSLEKVAIEYTKAYLSLVRAYDAGEKVRSLDEFDPKHMAWENRVYHAEERRDIAIDKLKNESIRFSIAKLGIESKVPDDVKEFLKYISKRKE